MILLLMIISVSNGKYYLIKTSDNNSSQDYMMSRNRAGRGCRPAFLRTYKKKEVACKRGYNYNYSKFWGFIMSNSQKVKEAIALSKSTQKQKHLLSVGKRLVRLFLIDLKPFFQSVLNIIQKVIIVSSTIGMQPTLQ